MSSFHGRRFDKSLRLYLSIAKDLTNLDLFKIIMSQIIDRGIIFLLKEFLLGPAYNFWAQTMLGFS